MYMDVALSSCSFLFSCLPIPLLTFNMGNAAIINKTQTHRQTDRYTNPYTDRQTYTIRKHTHKHKDTHTRLKHTQRFSQCVPILMLQISSMQYMYQVKSCIYHQWLLKYSVWCAPAVPAEKHFSGYFSMHLASIVKVGPTCSIVSEKNFNVAKCIAHSS